MDEELRKVREYFSAGRVDDAVDQFLGSSTFRDELRARSGEFLQILRSEKAYDWCLKNAESAFDFAEYSPRMAPSRQVYRVRDGQVLEWELDVDDQRPAMFAISNATVPAGKGMIATEDGAALWLAGSWAPPPNHHAERGYGVIASNETTGDALCRSYPPPSQVIPEAVYVYLGSKYFGANLYSLAELALAREVASPDVPLVTQARGAPSPFLLEAIRKMGFTRPDPIILADRPVTRVERLWVSHLPATIATRYVVSPIAFDLLRQQLGVGEDGSGPERVYISRRDAAYRKIHNEDELMATLETYGFVRLEFAAMNLAERLKALGSAKIIVGPIGSNMSNLLFAPSGAWVLEFLPQLYEGQMEVRDAVSSFAYTNSQNYVRLPCAIMPSEETRYTHKDFLVSLPDLRVGLDFAIDQIAQA